MMLSQSGLTQQSIYVLFHLPEVQEEASVIYSDRRKVEVITVAGGGGGREIDKEKVWTNLLSAQYGNTLYVD